MSYSEPRQFSSTPSHSYSGDRTLLFHPVEDGAAETDSAEEEAEDNSIILASRMITSFRKYYH